MVLSMDHIVYLKEGRSGNYMQCASVTLKDASLGLTKNELFFIKCEVKAIVCIISTSNRIRT